NMAIAVYGAQNTAYYTAGLLDQMRALLENEGDVVKHLTNYAIDCAVNKVNASEALDAIVDEALQIHGGYGYMQEYEIERLYREARINRIFEGTNEINRITIAKTLLKQDKQDNAIIEEETKQIQLESSSSFIRFSMRLLQIISKAQPHTKKQMVVKDQECLRQLADVIKELYVIKAALLRQRRATDNQRIEQLITEVLCEEGYRKIEAATISIISSTITDN